jgi:class 3 adenylate cyclase/predicted esterase
MEQQIHFCQSADGTRIAYSILGSGPPIVIVPPWVTHLEILWAIPPYRERLLRWAERVTVVTLEKRGNGLSDRNCTDFSLEARLADLEAVVDDLKLKRFALLGYSEGGPTSIAYAAKHPRRVTRMLLNGTWARGEGMFGTQALRDATIALIRAEWGVGASTLTELFMGSDAPLEFRHTFAQIQQTGCTKEDAANSMLANFTIDLRALLPKIRVPTLVVHARDDRVVPLELGREIAAGIPGARFVSRDGAHVPVTEHQIDELRDITEPFLFEDAGESATNAAAPAGSPFRTILFTDIVGHTPMMQRLGDAAGRSVLREHERITREQLAAHGGIEVKTIGDAFMASFTSATAALECAIALQRAFSDRNASAAEPLEVRIGLNAGEPIAEEGDYFGAAVTLASRIMAQAAGGEILASNVVRELCAGKGFLFADRGETVLRGFEDLARLYEVRWRE